MSDERELERHNKVIEKIDKAENREDIPNISFSNISSYLANNVYFDNVKLSQAEFKPVIKELINYGSIWNPLVRKKFIEVIINNYPNVSEAEILEKYKLIASSKRIGYIIEEIGLKNVKLDEINKRENLIIHKNIIKEIKQTFEIKDLPNVGLKDLNKRLIKALNDNDFNTNFKAGDIKEITNAYLNDYNFKYIEGIIIELCDKTNLNFEDKLLMREQIIGSLIQDETIEYVAQEINEKEKRKLFIYKNNHELTMDAIKEANRISKLPPNLTVSALTHYLNSNTTIYTNDNRIKTEDLKALTDLLLDGYKFEDEVIKKEIKNITDKVYPLKDDAYQLLFNKLSKLPRVYYLAQEINFSLSRQKEFIGNNCSNVNVYFIPNEKSPLDGGRFYNCYINRVQNLDLSEILPLNLDEIVPPHIDIDSIEWYVRENYDDTFKAAGGIILNRDETIGTVNVFRPNDGKIGITKEEKEKMDKLSNLDKEIEEKEKRLLMIEDQLKDREEKTKNTESELKEMIETYKNKVLALQVEMLKNIEDVKNGLQISSLNEKRKELK